MVPKCLLFGESGSSADKHFLSLGVVFDGDRVTVVITDAKIAAQVCLKRRTHGSLGASSLCCEALVNPVHQTLPIHIIGVRAVCRPREIWTRFTKTSL